MGKEYSKHLETHKEQGLYECTWPTCGKKCRTATALRQHYEKHQPKLLCEICGSFLSYKKGLGEHKKQHHGVREEVFNVYVHIKMSCKTLTAVKYNSTYCNVFLTSSNLSR
uniref:C2H2-type domain-containing protein n=2 Tax=Loa loa TaxID=7209 RepID=A0A1I7V6U5_LOALO